MCFLYYGVRCHVVVWCIGRLKPSSHNGADFLIIEIRYGTVSAASTLHKIGYRPNIMRNEANHKQLFYPLVNNKIQACQL